MVNRAAQSLKHLPIQQKQILSKGAPLPLICTSNLCYQTGAVTVSPWTLTPGVQSPQVQVFAYSFDFHLHLSLTISPSHCTPTWTTLRMGASSLTAPYLALRTSRLRWRLRLVTGDEAGLYPEPAQAAAVLGNESRPAGLRPSWKAGLCPSPLWSSLATPPPSPPPPDPWTSTRLPSIIADRQYRVGERLLARAVVSLLVLLRLFLMSGWCS